LCDNLAKGKDIKDDIGDMFVVLVMMCEIGKVDLAKAFDYSKIDTATGGRWLRDYDVAITWYLNLDIGELWEKVTVFRASDLIASLTAIADANDTTLDDCIDIAYNDIKDRKGYLTTDGVFVKDGAA
jgi:hypothetical protein